jgi:hypothetical protein
MGGRLRGNRLFEKSVRRPSPDSGRCWAFHWACHWRSEFLKSVAGKGWSLDVALVLTGSAILNAFE